MAVRVYPFPDLDCIRNGGVRDGADQQGDKYTKQEIKTHSGKRSLQRHFTSFGEHPPAAVEAIANTRWAERIRKVISALMS